MATPIPCSVALASVRDDDPFAHAQITAAGRSHFHTLWRSRQRRLMACHLAFGSPDIFEIRLTDQDSSGGHDRTTKQGPKDEQQKGPSVLVK